METPSSHEGSRQIRSRLHLDVYPGGYVLRWRCRQNKRRHRWQGNHHQQRRHAKNKEFAMCSPATCHTCGKATYSGCGQHVDQVLGGVPKNERCACAPAERNAGGPSLLGRLFGR